MVNNIKLSDFKYKLPKSSIAKFPVDPRNQSKMMVLNRETGEIQDKQFMDILSYIQKGDVIVLNETKVLPARIFGTKEKTNAKIEVLLLRDLKIAEENLWDVIVNPARKVREGNKVFFDGNKFFCEVIGNTTSRGRTVKFIYDSDIYGVVERMGEMPLPDYIDRSSEEFDKKAYQTEFANDAKINSIAPPTAGLHFTAGVIEKLEKKGVKIAKINVNIGQGIFSRIEVEDLSKHSMYHEYFDISLSAAEMINKSLKAKKNVYAVGCSVVRALESSVLTTGQIKPNRGWADKFIYPPYNFKIVSKLLTNFHPPASQSLLLACAFGNKENVLKAYRKAIRDDYRFHCYGDAMLII
jgi:S-adenosylmethionine:tRNA ribosyltransferase-isomerase